jgi:hypothetical protein
LWFVIRGQWLTASQLDVGLQQHLNFLEGIGMLDRLTSQLSTVDCPLKIINRFFRQTQFSENSANE